MFNVVRLGVRFGTSSCYPSAQRCRTPARKFSLVRAHLPDERLISSLFRARCPQDHLGKARGEVDPFRGESGVVALYYQTA
jgi:hypothetical protein